NICKLEKNVEILIGLLEKFKKIKLDHDFVLKTQGAYCLSLQSEFFFLDASWVNSTKRFDIFDSKEAFSRRFSSRIFSRT
ncbi:hypothetical protein BpHYR1_034122, partial [Brachionus plicatilis]